MAENPIVHISENSPEEVAYKLLQLVADVENRERYGHGSNPVDREWVLRTYAQCIRAVRLPSMISDVVKEFAPSSAPMKR